MNCPVCRSASKVVDSRPITDGIRRRRECLVCGRRFTTHEKVDPLEIRVIKNGLRSAEDFQSEKLSLVLRRVCKNRPISEEQIKVVMGNIEAKIEATNKPTISAAEIARLVAEALEKLDTVARFRFIANYSSASGNITFERLTSKKIVSTASEQLDLFKGRDEK